MKVEIMNISKFKITTEIIAVKVGNGRLTRQLKHGDSVISFIKKNFF